MTIAPTSTRVTDLELIRPGARFWACVKRGRKTEITIREMPEKCGKTVWAKVVSRPGGESVMNLTLYGVGVPLGTIEEEEERTLWFEKMPSE